MDLGTGNSTGACRSAPAGSPPTTGRIPRDHCGHVGLCRFLWIAHWTGGHSLCARHMLADLTASMAFSRVSAPMVIWASQPCHNHSFVIVNAHTLAGLPVEWVQSRSCAGLTLPFPGP